MVPLGMAPPGEIVNLTGGPSQAWMPRLAVYTTLPVAVISVLLRVYARLRMRVQLGLDDCTYQFLFRLCQCKSADVFRLVHTGYGK